MVVAVGWRPVHQKLDAESYSTHCQASSCTITFEAPDSASPLRTSTLCEYESASNDTSHDAESGASFIAEFGTSVINRVVTLPHVVLWGKNSVLKARERGII